MDCRTALEKIETKGDGLLPREEEAERAGHPAGGPPRAPVGAPLAVWALLFSPAGTVRSPFHPSTFDVAVEDVESDVATVALVDKGEDPPRVIWVIEEATPRP